jgi:hypothetical protein
VFYGFLGPGFPLFALHGFEHFDVLNHAGVDHDFLNF